MQRNQNITNTAVEMDKFLSDSYHILQLEEIEMDKNLQIRAKEEAEAIGIEKGKIEGKIEQLIEIISNLRLNKMDKEQIIKILKIDDKALKNPKIHKALND